MKKLYFTDKINVISINTTQLCNMRCPYCIMNSSFNKYPTDNHEKLVFSIKYLIENFSDNFFELKLDILGGEPLVVLDHTIEIMTLFKPYAQDFLIATNGELLTEDNINKLFDVAENVSFYIGFDTEQKSVFRFNEKLTRNIVKLNQAKKVHGFYVIEGPDKIKDIAENIKAIKSLTGLYPKVEYNFLRLDDLRKDKSLLPKIKEQLDEAEYVGLRLVQDGKYDTCNCGIINISAEGTISSCSDDMDSNFSFNDALQFKKDHCSKCSIKDYCCSCPLELTRYGGELFCQCVKTFKERI